MSYLTLFPTLRSQPFSRVLHDSRPFWTTLGAFDQILHDLDQPLHRDWFEANETDTAYTFTIALPGFKKSEVEIEVSEDTLLTVRAGKTNANDDRHSVSRTITLPSDADTSKIEAKLEDGLLSLTITKVEAAKPRKVVVS